jgi:hypothetical protein
MTFRSPKIVYSFDKVIVLLQKYRKLKVEEDMKKTTIFVKIKDYIKSYFVKINNSVRVIMWLLSENKHNGIKMKILKKFIKKN